MNGAERYVIAAAFKCTQCQHDARVMIALPDTTPAATLELLRHAQLICQNCGSDSPLVSHPYPYAPTGFGQVNKVAK